MAAYLDNAATTRPCDAATAAMKKALTDIYGNPSSLHTMGLEAEKAVNEARANIAAALIRQKLADVKKPERQLVFTSGGTEANNLAIIGTAMSKKRFAGGKIILGESEHSSVLECGRRLSELGFKVVTIPSPRGVWDMEKYRSELDRSVVLVSAMVVNNETGALHDVWNIVKLARELAPDASVHFDAVQAFCKFPLERFPDADLISVSSHKIYGPKGVGALYISERILKNGNISPVIFGGGQEQGLRSGTENTVGIIGFGAAAKEIGSDIAANAAHFADLYSYLCEKISSLPEGSVIINEPAVRVKHIVSLTVPKIRSETMLHHLSSRGVFVSSGSACSSNTRHRSSALSSFGLSDENADCTVRISFGLYNTHEDIDALICGLADGISRLARKR